MNESDGMHPAGDAEVERLARRNRMLKIGGTIASAALFAIAVGVLYLVIQ